MAKTMLWIYVIITLLNGIIGVIFFDVKETLDNLYLFWGIIAVLAICETLEGRLILDNKNEGSK